MAKATWKGIILADSDKVIVVEENRYFPPDSVNWAYLRQSEKHSTCFWKGQASYWDIVVDGEVNNNAAWYYPETKPAADYIKSYVAFWRGVRVED